MTEENPPPPAHTNSEQRRFTASPDDAPPAQPDAKQHGLQWKSLLWVAAAAVMPGFAMFIAEAGKTKAAQELGTIVFLFALIAQIAFSIILGIAIAKRIGKGAGFAVLFVIVLLGASVIVGSASFFAGCLAANPNPNFH